MDNSKPIIKLNYADFWPTFNKYDNYFSHILSPHFNLQISDTPDFLIYSCFGTTYKNFKGIRIFYTGENIRPDFRACDFAISFDYNQDSRHFRLPTYIQDELSPFRNTEEIVSRLSKPKNIEEIMQRKTEFCSFLVSNPHASKRIAFFKALSQYKKVDSGGKVLNNLKPRYPIKNKLSFLSPYKFNICFENSSYPGYTTEKLLNAMYSNCIAIYWGDPLVHQVFNTKSFINIRDYSNFSEAIEHIIEINNNKLLYRSYLNEPYLLKEGLADLKTSKVIAFFTNIFQQKYRIKPIAQNKIYPYILKIEHLQKRIQGKIKKYTN